MKFLIHLHIYYHNQTDYFINKLSNIEDCEWDLIVTYSQENPETINKLKSFRPDTTFIKVKNLGYDVWPFIQAIRMVDLDNYDYVLKIHTKNFSTSKDDLFKKGGFYWREELINPILGSKRKFKKNIEILKKDKNIGLMASKSVYVRIGNTLPEETFLLYYLQKRLNIKSKIDKFIAGTVFIIKSEVLKIIQQSDLSEKDFLADSKSHSKGTIAHTTERIFSALPLEKNYKIYLIEDSYTLKTRICRFLRNFFYLSNSNDRFYKVINILGFKIHLKREPKFPKNTINYESKIITNEIEYKNKRAGIFATYTKDGIISDNIIKYLTEAKKYLDYIVVVSDNPIYKEEIKKIDTLANTVIFKRHGEYNFGSYKRGYLKLKNIGILDNIDYLLFFDDSVLYEGGSFEKFFKNSSEYDFYGMIQNKEKFFSKKSEITFDVYIQSWFFTLSENIFKTEWFDAFMQNITSEKSKFEMIKKYEFGLSDLIKKHGFNLNTYYPYYEDYDENQDIFFTHPNNNFEDRLFIKKRFLKQ